MMFSVFQASHKGARRVNEDRMGYGYTKESALFALADGMGGHPMGEVAAQVALQTLAAMFQKEARPRLADVKEFLTVSLLAAHQQIIRGANEHAMTDTPRTTLVACVVQDGQARWIHCGDSRLYLLREGKLLNRTRDHSYIEYPNFGGIKRESINRNVLFTCLGAPTKPLFDVSEPYPLRRGDRIMLCSDGLWGVMDEQAIVSIMTQGAIENAVPESVELALRNGGEVSDNVTVIAMEWETPDAVDPMHSVFTDAVSEGVFASTIQAGGPDGFVEDMDEATIERSIAEINNAIRKSTEQSEKF